MKNHNCTTSFPMAPIDYSYLASWPQREAPRYGVPLKPSPQAVENFVDKICAGLRGVFKTG
ncbi:hypothetical protein [Achromobacter insolitus]|uniref:hypothetical protein n=1 Tax=Achromobacter insolitus TaxID=217204 RepID=UPI002FE1334F